MVNPLLDWALKYVEVAAKVGVTVQDGVDV
jgi:hypothetical protein